MQEKTGPGPSTPRMEADPALQAAAAEAKSILQVGTLYTGVVTERSANNTYTVRFSSPRRDISGVVLLSSIFSGLLGYNDDRALGVGQPVAVAYGNPSFIIGGLPDREGDEKNGGGRSVAAGDPVSDVGYACRYGGQDIAKDLVEGEFDIKNYFRVGLRFLTTLMAMTAGDRAKVEVHLQEDMVRIISGQFRHIGPMGEELIFDHGRPTGERNFTSYRHEVMGQLKDGDPLATMKGDEVDLEAINRINALGRHRFTDYMGFVGDFIHRFVTDPPTTLVNMTEAASGRRAGKFWDHVGSDGSYIMQSTSEIRFERVTRIPVVTRYENHNDPKITKERKYRELNQQFLKLWDYGSLAEGDAYRTTYQLRQYARWFTRFNAFARALQLPNEYDIPSESASPLPDWNNGEEDRKTVNADTEYFEAYSCYTMFRDGSQLIYDGYGSSITLSNGNVQVSAARHLDLEAAGDIRMVAGGSLFVKARRHIEMSASLGGIIFHSFAFIRALCERGSIWLRSDAHPDSPDAKPGGDPEIKPEILEQAIVLDAPRQRIALRSMEQISLTVEGGPTGDGENGDKSADIMLSTRGHVRVRADKDVFLAAQNSLVMTGTNMVAKSSQFYAEWSEVDINKKIFMNPTAGLLQCRIFNAERITANTAIQGPEVGPIPPPDGGGPPVGPHFNHIYQLLEPVELRSGDDENTREHLGFADTARKQPIAPWNNPSAGPKWNFLADSTYYWDFREERTGVLVQTVTQQHITLDPTHAWGGGEHYDTWNWKADRLVIGIRVGNNVKGFGGNATQYRSNSNSKTDDLHTATSKSPSSLSYSAPSWTTVASVTFKTLKQKPTA